MWNFPIDHSGHSSLRRTLQRLGGIVVTAGAAISLALMAMSFWHGGRHWSGVTIPLGLACLGICLIVGPRRRALYYSLLALSFLLTLFSLVLLLAGRG